MIASSFVEDVVAYPLASGSSFVFVTTVGAIAQPALFIADKELRFDLGIMNIGSGEHTFTDEFRAHIYADMSFVPKEPLAPVSWLNALQGLSG